MKKSERTKEYIIERVAPLFNKKGFAGTSLNDLTDATGLTKGSIYGNFRNKDEVAVQAFLYNYRLLTDEVRIRLKANTRADQKLLTFVNYYKENYGEIFERGGCALMNAAIDSDDGNPVIFSEVRHALQSWKETIERIAVEGNRRSETCFPDPERFACMMVALQEGSILLAKTSGRSDYLIYNAEFLENYIHQHTLPEPEGKTV